MRGWILDLYPGNPGEMVVWLKLENGEVRRLLDRWSPSIFVASDDGYELARLGGHRLIEPEVLGSRLVGKVEQITDQAKSEVLELQVKDAKKTQLLARRIEGLGPFGLYRIYNADVPPAQTYLYERDLFPLAHCEVSEAAQRLEWRLHDDDWSYDYVIPELRETKVEVEVEREGRIARNTDTIRSVKLTSREEEIVIESGSEGEKILEVVKALEELDPDLLLTEEGDTFLLPYLIKRAENNGLSERFFLDRDKTRLTLPSRAGTSYFSYGKILFKPSAMKLCGRVHLDLSSSFVCNGPNLEGLFELSRICRMPLQTASRASIGKALSSLQFYHASKMDLLVPWKPVIAEKFKDRWTLMVADRGGFIFEPKVGLFEGVGELDYSCLVKDSTVMTRNGEKSIAEVKEDNEVFTPFGWQRVSKVHEYRINEKVIRLTLSDGKRITCTTHHKFPVLVRDVFEEKVADEIRKGNRFIITDPPPAFQNDDLACLFGAFTAEGGRLRRDQEYFDKSRKKTRVSHQYRIEFSINKHEIDFRNFITKTLSKIYPSVHVYIKTKLGSDGITLVVAQRAVVMDFLSRYESFIASEHHNQGEQASFVRGFFEGDGGINKKRNTVQCDQSSKNHFKLDIVCKCLRELNIGYRVGRYINKHGFSSIPADFLELSGLEAVVRYYTQVGFISQDKQESLRQAILSRIRKAKNYPSPRLGLYAKARKNNALSFIHEVRVIGKEIFDYDGHVYDLTLEWSEFPYYFANGILTHNSLYPNIMLKKNLSAETVRCPCCPSSINRIPELDWNVCQRRKGIVPKAIEIIVGKRLRYKELKRSAKSDKDRERYDARQSALKYLGVTSFGYLGYNNAKFGRIDAHIGVCAWDRKVLLDATRIAERSGFKLIHGIVDSLWLKRQGAEEEDYKRLRREIEEETGFEISFEGIYKWVVFLPSRVEPGIPVLNRYFGAYRTGELKVRGIEARRHDTPVLFTKCQMEILELLARADSIAGARELIPECLGVFEKYARAISNREVPPESMIFTRNLSKKPGEYLNRTIQSSVADQLSEEGIELHAGESVRYLITDYYSGSPRRRAAPESLIDDGTPYDVRRYVELLAEACSTVLEPFDGRCSPERLVGRLQDTQLSSSPAEVM